MSRDDIGAQYRIRSAEMDEASTSELPNKIKPAECQLLKKTFEEIHFFEGQPPVPKKKKHKKHEDSSCLEYPMSWIAQYHINVARFRAKVDALQAKYPPVSPIDINAVERDLRLKWVLKRGLHDALIVDCPEYAKSRCLDPHEYIENMTNLTEKGRWLTTIHYLRENMQSQLEELIDDMIRNADPHDPAPVLVPREPIIPIPDGLRYDEDIYFLHNVRDVIPPMIVDQKPIYSYEHIPFGVPTYFVPPSHDHLKEILPFLPSTLISTLSNGNVPAFGSTCRPLSARRKSPYSVSPKREPKQLPSLFDFPYTSSHSGASQPLHDSKSPEFSTFDDSLQSTVAIDRRIKLLESLLEILPQTHKSNRMTFKKDFEPSRSTAHNAQRIDKMSRSEDYFGPIRKSLLPHPRRL